MTPKLCECECFDWTRDYSSLATHHRNCKHYDPEGDGKAIIADLLKAMRYWASDEDGVHPEACDAYDRAALSIGEMPLKDEIS